MRTLHKLFRTIQPIAGTIAAAAGLASNWQGVMAFLASAAVFVLAYWEWATRFGITPVILACLLAVACLLSIFRNIGGLAAPHQQKELISIGELIERQKALEGKWSIKVVETTLLGNVIEEVAGERIFETIQFDLTNETTTRISDLEVSIQSRGVVMGHNFSYGKEYGPLYLQNTRRVDYVNSKQSERYILMSRERGAPEQLWWGDARVEAQRQKLDHEVGRYKVTISVLTPTDTSRFDIQIVTTGSTPTMLVIEE